MTAPLQPLFSVFFKTRRVAMNVLGLSASTTGTPASVSVLLAAVIVEIISGGGGTPFVVASVQEISNVHLLNISTKRIVAVSAQLNTALWPQGKTLKVVNA